MIHLVPIMALHVEVHDMLLGTVNLKFKIDNQSVV